MRTFARGLGLAAGATLLAIALARGQAPGTVAPNSECWKCHLALEGAQGGPAHGYGEDIHAQNGLTCSDCHGGNPAAVDVGDAKDRTFRGVPRGKDVVAVCGRCHSDATYMRRFNPALPVDQAEKYATSVHGQLLAAGDAKAAVCISCHGVHGILPADRPRSLVYARNLPATCGRCHADSAYMAPYGIATDQYRKYRASVHGVALLVKGDQGAPACNDCHGNHGAAPPGVEDLSRVCGLCHALNAELFAAGPHAAAFEAAELPQCEACHGNHAVAAASDSLVDAQRGICASCHGVDDAGGIAAGAMRATLDSLALAYAQSETLLGRAAQKGMEVGQATFELKEARQSLIEARTATHTVTPARVRAAAAKGREITLRAIEEGRRALADYQFRRRGLGVATLILSLFAVVLYLKIRRTKSPPRP
jgi:predicted CXXCH cytochrome family protein